MAQKFTSLRTSLKVLTITLKQVKSITWIMLSISILGAINYEGRVFTITSQNGFLRGANSIIYQILLTFITGFIILFINDLQNKTKKRIAITSTLGNRVLLINERVHYLINQIGRYHNTYEKEFEITVHAFRECCEVINIDVDKVNVWFYPEITFREFIRRSCEDIRFSAEGILAFSDVLDESWVNSASGISMDTFKIEQLLDIRFASPKVDFYYTWGLYGRSLLLMNLLNKFDNHHLKPAIDTAQRFHPEGRIFKVNREQF